MPSYDDAVTMPAGWPGVTADTWYGTPGLKVGGKGFCRMWSDREYKRDGVDDTEVLVVLCDVDEKEALIDASDGVLFSTSHYDGHGGMLIRLADVEPAALEDYLLDSWYTKATPKLIAELGDAA